MSVAESQCSPVALLLTEALTSNAAALPHACGFSVFLE